MIDAMLSSLAHLLGLEAALLPGLVPHHRHNPVLALLRGRLLYHNG